MKLGHRVWIPALLAVFFLAVPVVAQDVVDVPPVTGQGLSEDSALKDALRKALEQGGGVEISSRSQVENFQLIRDTVFARADGIVTDYKILEKGDAAGGLKYCKIAAKVSKSAIASTWGEVQNVLEQVGSPGIMVYIQESIDSIPQESSILEAKIEEVLLARGFKLYSRTQLSEIEKKEIAAANADNQFNKVLALAKQFGTQIFITGHSNANFAEVAAPAGVETVMYNGDGMFKMYYTDTAQLIASESLANWRGGARGYNAASPQAGRKALENAGFELVERLYQNVMRSWATKISAGGELQLEVTDISAGDAIKLKKKLKDINPDKILSVNVDVTKGMATYRIKAKMTGEELVEHLSEGEFESLLSIDDLKTNRIQAKWKGE